MIGMMTLVLGSVLAVFAGLSLFLEPRLFAPVEGDGWRSELPRLALSHETRTDGPWTSVSRTGAATFRIGTRPLEGAPSADLEAAAAAIHPHPCERIPIPSLSGTFLLSGRGKSWRATLLFPAGGRLFAVESVENRGNAAEPLFAVSRMAARLEVDGAPLFVAPDAQDLDAAIRPAVNRHLVGMGAVMPVIVPVLLLALGITFALVAFGGRVPARGPGEPPAILSEGHVALTMKRSWWQYRQTVGAMVLDDRGLHVSTLGREVLFVPTSDLHAIRRGAGFGSKRPFVVVKAGLEVRFAPADPHRWERAFGMPSGAV